ncbi:MAG: hypothetical protein MR004_01640 [Clostridiales bacterium]|nr:hypothetical protein [Clostridiales bacterium]MDY4037654.1 hypothetical protein [Candidatus Pseudoscilispira sp.]
MELFLYHGTKQTNILQLASGIQWGGDKDRAARSVTFSLLKSSLDANLPAVECANGDHVELLEGGKSKFFGMVVSVTTTTTAPTVRVTVYDRGIYLSNNDGTYKFSTTPEAAARQICTVYGIPLASAVSTGITIRRKFSAVSLWDIICTMYAKAGEKNGKRYMARFVGRSLEIVERKTGATNLVIKSGSNLLSASTTKSIVNLRNSVAIYDSDGKRLQVVEDRDAVNLYGLMQRHITQRDGEDAAAEAKSILEDNAQEETVTVTALGDFSVICGETVVVRQEDTKLQGIFWVDADVHTFDQGLHKMQLTLNLKNVGYEADAGSELDE